MKPPRNYQALHDEHARQTQVPGQPNADNAQSEPESTRPPFRPPSPGWTDSPRMDMNQTSAVDYHNWANANAAQRQSAQPDVSVGIAEKAQQRDKADEKLMDKEALATDLQVAKDAGRSAKPQQGNDHDAPAPEAAKQEKPGGKAALAEDLKAAKESAKATDQSRDTGRSR